MLIRIFHIHPIISNVYSKYFIKNNFDKNNIYLFLKKKYLKINSHKEIFLLICSKYLSINMRLCKLILRINSNSSRFKKSLNLLKLTS